MASAERVPCANRCRNVTRAPTPYRPVAGGPWPGRGFAGDRPADASSYPTVPRTDFGANGTLGVLYDVDGAPYGGRGGGAGGYNVWALPLLVFPLLTLFGNVLVILSVARERSLQTATNYFIVSLAVADLLVAVAVMPFGVYYLFNGEWGLPAFVCDCYIAMDVTCSTSSIFNLVAISVDRYIAVTQPIKYAKHKGRVRVWATVAAAWLASVAIGSPALLGLNDAPDRSPDACLFNNTDYVIYSSLGSFYVPCVVMMCLYYKIFKAIRRRAKKQRVAKKTSTAAGSAASGGAAAAVGVGVGQDDKPTNTASGSNEDDDENFDRTEMGVFADELARTRSTRFMLAAVVEETGLIMANLASPIPTMDQNTINDSGYVPSNVEIDKENTPPPSPGWTARKEEDDSRPITKKPELKKKLSRLSSSSVVTTPRRRFKSATAAARFTISRANRAGKLRAKSFAKKEKKATQTLAIVLGVFLFCWAPFFTCSVLDAVCTKFGLAHSPGVAVFIFTTWLGYINSFLNPVIYTIYNPEFRKAFRKILRFGT